MKRAASSMACHRRNGRSATRGRPRQNSRRPSSNRKEFTSRRSSAIVPAARGTLSVASHPTEVVVAKSGFAKEHLRSFIERVERLEEERAALTADIREVYSEAKGQGFDAKTMRRVVRMRRLDKADFQEQEAMLDLYLSALGMR